MPFEILYQAEFVSAALGFDKVFNTLNFNSTIITEYVDQQKHITVDLVHYMCSRYDALVSGIVDILWKARSTNYAIVTL